MSGLWLMLFGLVMFAVGGFSAWTISTTVIRFIEDMHDQKARANMLEGQNDSLQSKNEIQEVRLMIKEMEDLHRVEIGMYQDRVAVLEQENEEVRAQRTEDQGALRQQLNRMKKRHKRASKMYNEERKKNSAYESDKMVLVSGFNKRIKELELRIEILVAEALGFQMVLQSSDEQTKLLENKLVEAREEYEETLTWGSSQHKMQIFVIEQEFKKEKAKLHKKIKRINSRRKAASKIHMELLKNADNRAYENGIAADELRKKLGGAAEIITSLRNTR